MLLSQFLVLVLSALKRFDAVVLHARESAREVLNAARGMRSSSEADFS